MEQVLEKLDELSVLPTMDDADFALFIETYRDDPNLANYSPGSKPFQLSYISYKLGKLFLEMKNFMPMSPDDSETVFKKILRIPFAKKIHDFEPRGIFSGFSVLDRRLALNIFRVFNGEIKIDDTFISKLTNSEDVYLSEIDKQIRNTIVEGLVPFFHEYELNKYGEFKLMDDLSTFYNTYEAKFDADDQEFFAIVCCADNLLDRIKDYLNQFKSVVNVFEIFLRYRSEDLEDNLKICGSIFENTGEFVGDLVTCVLRNGQLNKGCFEYNLSNELDNRIDNYFFMIDLPSGFNVGDPFYKENLKNSINECIISLENRIFNEYDGEEPDPSYLTLRDEIDQLKELNDRIKQEPIGFYQDYYIEAMKICDQIIEQLLRENRSNPILK